MKRIIHKIALSLLLLSCGTQTVHAGLSQMVKSTAHTMLKKIGENPGWLAYAGMGYGMYKYIEDEEIITDLETKRAAIIRVLKGAFPIGFAAVVLSAACKWWASKF